MFIDKIKGGPRGDYNNELRDTVNDLVSVANSIYRKPVHQVSLSNKLQSVATENITWCYMFMVPVEYSGVRLCYNHLGGNGGATDITALIAPSDEIGDLSYANTSEGRKYATPWEDGLEVNTISPRGWHSVTWNNGDSSVSVADPGADEMATSWSDFIECHARPLNDDHSGRFTGYYPVIVRVYEGTGRFTRGSLGGFSSVSDFVADSGSRLIQGGFKVLNAVSDPSLWDNTKGINQNDGSAPAIGLEFYSADRSVKSFISVGDSRFAIAAPSQVASKEYNCTQWLIEQVAIESGDKYSAFPSAQSGKDTETYANRAFEIMSKGENQFTHSLYLAYSINNGLPTRQIIDQCKFLLMRHVEQCSELGVVPIIVDAFPFGTGYTEDQLLLLRELQKTITQMNLYTFSPLDNYGDSLGGWKPGFNEDSDHMTPQGYRWLATDIYNLMKDVP